MRGGPGGFLYCFVQPRDCFQLLCNPVSESANWIICAKNVFKTDISFYATPNFSFPVTTAFRFGGAVNVGNYKFFQANALGSNSNLRGFRNNRFSGRSYLYQNSEVRFKVTYFRNYIFTGDMGLFGFFDSGRVYSDGPEASTWHKGYGPGIWFNLYNKALITGGYGFSKEGSYLTLKAGMSF